MEESILVQQLNDPRSRERAFQALMTAYREMLYWHVRKIVLRHEDADDVLQNTFVKAWTNLDKFRGDSKLKTWLYRIATNEALSHLKKEKRRQHDDLVDIQNSLGHSRHQEQHFSGDEIQQKLQEAVAGLPEKQRLVFNMKYFDDLKYEEIAEVLGGSIGSLKASFHHATKKVEKFMKESLNLTASS